MMNKNEQEDVKRIALTTSADRVTIHRDGTVSVYRGYFYRMGMTAEKFAQQIEEALNAAGYNAVVYGYDVWKQWPTDSYFRANVVSI